MMKQGVSLFFTEGLGEESSLHGPTEQYQNEGHLGLEETPFQRDTAIEKEHLWVPERGHCLIKET